MSTYRAWCKAKKAGEGELPQRSAGWSVAKRAWFEVFPDRFECGSWSIQKSRVRKATVFRTRQLMISFPVLHLETDEGAFQFGFNPWARPVEHLGIECEEQEVKLGYSRFSIIARTAIVLYLVYWFWSDIIAR